MKLKKMLSLALSVLLGLLPLNPGVAFAGAGGLYEATLSETSEQMFIGGGRFFSSSRR